MSWLVRGIQSAIFHYVSCAPCTGYMDRKQRKKRAKQARKARLKLQMEQPELYHHPEPTGTNPFWQEEISLGPGPPPRRARRSNTCSTKAAPATGVQDTVVSHGSSSIDVSHSVDIRLSDDTQDDDNWNRKRYQREDEHLWGLSDLMEPLHATMSGLSAGVAGLKRPSTSRSGSQYSVRAPPVNDLHPPVVSLPSPHPSDNQWMLQPPPKASVMSGKERATYRSRSGSGASSRVELSLQRQVSAKKLRQKLERGETPELPSGSRGTSYCDLVAGQRHERPNTPQARPPSASSYHRRTRRDTAMTRTDTLEHSSGDSSDTVMKHSPSTNGSIVPDLKPIRVRPSRQQLSTVVSSASGEPPSLSPTSLNSASEHENKENFSYHTPPTSPDDVLSLGLLEDLVSPHALLNSRFVSAPLMEARIKLPPSDKNEQDMLNKESWSRSDFQVYNDSLPDVEQGLRVPFDSVGVVERDPRLRWSVDF